MKYESADHSTLGYPTNQEQNGTGTIKTDFTSSDITKEELNDILPESEESSPAKSMNKVSSDNTNDQDVTADVSIDGRSLFSPSIENAELSEKTNGKGKLTRYWKSSWIIEKLENVDT